MMGKNKNGIKFVTYAFFALSFFLIALTGIMNPSLTAEAVLFHPVYSRLNVPLGCVVHVLANVLFAAIALLFAFRSLRE